MCMSQPDVPTPVARQDSRVPERPASGKDNGLMSRRRGYAALIKTATGGDLSPVSTTAAPAAQKLGA